MIHGLRFDVKDRDRLETLALQSAVKHAMTKAQALAAGANRSIDHVMQIEELSEGGAPPPRPFAMAARAEAATPVAPGELEIRATVRVTAAIK